MTTANGAGQAPRQGEPVMSPRTRVAILTVRRALIMMANALGELVGQPPVRPSTSVFDNSESRPRPETRAGHRP